MNKKVKKVAILTIGVVFIILGLFGLVLPFLQGFLFLAIGLILLSFSSPGIRITINKYAKRYPHLSNIIKKTDSWVAKFMGEQ